MLLSFVIQHVALCIIYCGFTELLRQNLFLPYGLFHNARAVYKLLPESLVFPRLWGGVWIDFLHCILSIIYLPHKELGSVIWPCPSQQIPHLTPGSG